MQTILLFATDYPTPHDAHLALKRLLQLPDYYGCNADALADCLSNKHPVSLWLAGLTDSPTSQALRKCAEAVQDHGGYVKYLA